MTAALDTQLSFDYTALDTETRNLVWQRTNEIKVLMRRTAQDILDIGEKLTEVKTCLGHGNFGAWLKAEFEWGQDTAQNFINVASKFGNFPNLPEIAPSALYLLASPSVPQAARDEVIVAAQSGQRVTVEQAKRVIAEHQIAQAPAKLVESLQAQAPAIFEQVQAGEITIPEAKKEIKRQEREQALEDRREKGREQIRSNGRYDVRTAACIEALNLPAASVDWIITDPPYPKDFLKVYEELSEVAAHVLKPGGSMLCMVGQSYLPEVIRMLGKHMSYHWTLAYLTPGGQATQLFQRNVNTFWKPVLWHVNGVYSGEWIGDVTRSATNNNDKAHHHWGQSESGMADLMGRFVKAGDVVLDPFLGGDTTGVIALETGCRFIGFDVSEDAVNTSLARFAEVL